MTNLSVAEKQALEEVFICLQDSSYRRKEMLNKRLMFYKLMKLYVQTKRMFPILKR
ncbi:MAG: hypothetical protein PHN38_03395 [Sulfurospirillaceae bacterium]|nr:hypothetical protein [Sulfurospirillaceae bacterium]